MGTCSQVFLYMQSQMSYAAYDPCGAPSTASAGHAQGTAHVAAVPRLNSALPTFRRVSEDLL